MLIISTGVYFPHSEKREQQSKTENSVKTQIQYEGATEACEAQNANRKFHLSSLN